MYDITNLISFKHIKEWINNIKENIDISKIGIIIVGNKCESSPENVVVDEETKIQFEKQMNIKIIEASSKNNINVNESFLLLVDKMIELGIGKYKKNNCDDKDKEDNSKKLSDGKKINPYYNEFNHISKLFKLDKFFKY